MTEFQNPIEIFGAKIIEIHTIKPFTINVKKPKVTIIIGNDKIVRIVFSELLTTEKIRPAKKKVPTLWLLTFPKIETKIHSKKLFKNHRFINVIN